MKKFFVKENLDYLILAIWVLLITVSWPFYIVVNHYMHYLAAPVAIVVVCYGIYVVVERSIKPEKWHKWVALGVGFLVFMIWALGVKQPTLRAYLGSDMIVMKSEKDVKQVAIESNTNGYLYALYFNPNCETCQDVIPKLLAGKNIKDFDLNIVRQNIAFVDTTQDYGKEMAAENDVETVPSYMFIGNGTAGEVKKLGYHTDNGTKYLEKAIGRLQEDAKWREKGKEYKE